VTRDEIMAPFATRMRATFHHSDGFKVDVVENPRDRSCMGGGASRDAALASLRSALHGLRAEGWSLFGSSGISIHPAPPEPEDMTAEEYHQRGLAMEATLACAGVKGADEVRHLPAGWTKVLEIACDGITNRMSLPDAGSVSIGQAKEKFGTLRLYLHVDGGDDFISDIRAITDWAEGETETRCAATGRPGTFRKDGWIMVLDDETDALRRRDRTAFGRRIYPPAPETEPAPAP
jgi:hypothetical protein